MQAVLCGQLEVSTTVTNYTLHVNSLLKIKSEFVLEVKNISKTKDIFLLVHLLVLWVEKLEDGYIYKGLHLKS